METGKYIETGYVFIFLLFTFSAFIFNFFVRPTTKKLVQFEDMYSVFICTVLKFGFEYPKTKFLKTHCFHLFSENTDNPPPVNSLKSVHMLH